MTDGPDPRDVLRRVDSRLGKTSDPFATYKLEEVRERLATAIDKRDAIDRQHRIIVAGHGEVDTDKSAELVGNAEEQLAEAERDARQLAAFIAGLLDAADDGRNLRDYIAEQRDEQMRQLSAAHHP